MPNTSIIILTYNNLEFTKACIESIKKYTEPDTYEIIVVDNNSEDDTVSYLKELKDITLICNEKNEGFPKGCNIGIAHAQKENDILLLNNDTIVTTNWLKNLKIALYSSDNVGAVGAISNHQENLQGCDFTYEDFESMQEKAKENNQSNKEKWEEKVCLIGYCMLIKRTVFNLIGALNEGYSPGYIEDNDLSLNIIEKGYKLLLCHDAFIHHYLGTEFRRDTEKFNQLILKNRAYFESIWHFNVFTFDETRNGSIFLAEKPHTILNYQCGIGASSLRIKYLFPKTTILGIEEDKAQKQMAEHFHPVYSKIEELPQIFDTIFIGQELERQESPLLFLRNIKKHLKPQGYIIGETSNIANIDNLKLLLKDEWYYTNFTKKNHFTKSDLIQIFSALNFQNIYIYSYQKELNDEEKSILRALDIEESNLKNTYYAFRIQLCS